MDIYQALELAAAKVEHWRIERAGVWDAVKQDYLNPWYQLALSNWDAACRSHNRLVTHPYEEQAAL